jgi:hypothetical protein
MPTTSRIETSSACWMIVALALRRSRWAFVSVPHGRRWRRTHASARPPADAASRLWRTILARSRCARSELAMYRGRGPSKSCQGCGRKAATAATSGCPYRLRSFPVAARVAPWQSQNTAANGRAAWHHITAGPPLGRPAVGGKTIGQSERHKPRSSRLHSHHPVGESACPMAELKQR